MRACHTPAGHVFFDDAMELDDDEDRVVNTFVKNLVECMNEAARCVFKLHNTSHSFAPGQ